MTLSKAIELLGIERECVSRDCDRDCGRCDLVQDQSELLEMYDEVIRVLSRYECAQTFRARDRWSEAC